MKITFQHIKNNKLCRNCSNRIYYSPGVCDPAGFLEKLITDRLTVILFIGDKKYIANSVNGNAYLPKFTFRHSKMYRNDYKLYKEVEY
jgi:hypothetical protein